MFCDICIILMSCWVLFFQSKFWFDDPTMRKGYVMSALGSRCKDVKLRLWKEHKRNDQLQTLQNRPNNVPEEQWEHFVHMRFTEKWKVKFIYCTFICCIFLIKHI